MDYNNDSESKGIKAIEKFSKKMETDADEQFIHGVFIIKMEFIMHMIKLMI